FLVSLAEPDDRLHSEMPEMIHRERNFHSNGVPHGGHVLFERRDAFIRHLHREQWVRHFALLPVGQVAPHRHSTRLVGHHFYSQIHFQPGESHLFFALFHALRVDLWILRLGRIGINANLVAHFSAQHHVYRNVVNLACDVPQRHFNRAHAARLPRWPSKLLDLAKNPVDLKWILADDPAL